MSYILGSYSKRFYLLKASGLNFGVEFLFNRTNEDKPGFKKPDSNNVILNNFLKEEKNYFKKLSELQT